LGIVKATLALEDGKTGKVDSEYSGPSKICTLEIGAAQIPFGEDGIAEIGAA
jgi:hypothetical protein